AKRQLVAAGVQQGRILMSAPAWQDDVAGEAPGQSYENQPGQGSGGWLGLRGERAGASERRAARHGEAVRSRPCVVSVDAASRREQKDIAQLLYRHGARRISEDLG